MLIKVITLKNNKDSLRMAKKCAASISSDISDVDLVNAYDATKGNIYSEFRKEGFAKNNFYKAWSTQDRSMACFLSHYRLWQECVEKDEPMIILEHDAVYKKDDMMQGLIYAVNDIPKGIEIVNLGEPYNKPFPLPKKDNAIKGSFFKPFSNTTGSFLKGAHAYLVTPFGASRLIKKVKKKAPSPVSLFIDTNEFKVAEIYPHPFKVEESYSTVIV